MMKMLSKQKFLALTLISILLIIVWGSNMHVTAETTNVIKIFGLVNRPMNLTYAELFSMPTVSEIINLECVFHYPNVTLNWTGVPLFHLLTLAQIKPEAREVVFRAPDRFSSSITMEKALNPTTILAFKANETVLSEVSQIADIQGGIRIVVPCKWGYKWVTGINEIEVVDYDYKGSYESSGFSDAADIPNCELPSIVPPLQTFNLTFGARNFHVEVFTNATISAFQFNYSQKEIRMNITVSEGTSGYTDVILPQSLLKGPFSALLNDNPINLVEANITNLSFLYLQFPEGSHTAKIVGAEFFGAVPEIIVDFNSTVYVDETVTFNANSSVDDGQIVSYEWDFGDGENGNGTIVSHSYSKEGIYYVKLNVTDNDSLSNSEIFTVNVKNHIDYIGTLLRVSLVTMLALAVILFVILLIKKRQ